MVHDRAAISSRERPVASRTLSLGVLLSAVIIALACASPDPLATRSPFGIGTGGPHATAEPGPTDADEEPTGGAPEWLRAGARITWYVATASSEIGGYAWIRDPDGPWVDPRTGERYRREDTSPMQPVLGQDQGGASGDGVAQLDVVALDGDRAIASLTIYGIDHANAQWVPSAPQGGAVPAEGADGVWIDPSLLASDAERGREGWVVLHGPYALADATYDSVSFVWGPVGAHEASYTYDKATGIMLASNTAAGGRKAPRGSGGTQAWAAPVTLTSWRFLGLRQRSVPGSTGRAPDWLAEASELLYSGTYTLVNPLYPQGGGLSVELEHRVTLGEGGDGWRAYSARNILRDLGRDESWSTAGGPSALYWHDPEALAGMRQGELLDADPITGERLSVAFVGEAPSGDYVVVIENRLPGAQEWRSYSLDGILIAFEAEYADGGTVVLELASRH